MARMHAPHLPRTARLSAVTGLGAAVLASAFALPAKAEPVDAVQRGPAKIVAAQRDQQRKRYVVKRGDSLSAIAKRAKLASWRPIWDLNKAIAHPTSSTRGSGCCSRPRARSPSTARCRRPP